MGIADRPATCASCGTRLSRKQVYYRNGYYFCKRRCWETGREKLEKERVEAKAKSKKAEAGQAPQTKEAAPAAEKAPAKQDKEAQQGAEATAAPAGDVKKAKPEAAEAKAAESKPAGSKPAEPKPSDG